MIISKSCLQSWRMTSWLLKSSPLMVMLKNWILFHPTIKKQMMLPRRTGSASLDGTLLNTILDLHQNLIVSFDHYENLSDYAYLFWYSGYSKRIQIWSFWMPTCRLPSWIQTLCPYQQYQKWCLSVWCVFRFIHFKIILIFYRINCPAQFPLSSWIPPPSVLVDVWQTGKWLWMSLLLQNIPKGHQCKVSTTPCGETCCKARGNKFGSCFCSSPPA